MVAFNFSPEHVGPVERLEKLQTVRRTRKGKPGDRCQLFTGMRTKACRKLVDPDPVLVTVTFCAIRPDYLTLGNVNLFPGDWDDFARADGFKDYVSMVAWFMKKYRTPFFIGYVHVWRPYAP